MKKRTKKHRLTQELTSGKQLAAPKRSPKNFPSYIFRISHAILTKIRYLRETITSFAMSTTTITIRPATASDASIIASALAMALGEASMRMYCGENYREVLKELARMEHTQYSYCNALVADVNGHPAGAIVGYDGARLHELRKPTLALIQERTGQRFEGVEDETSSGEYYLDSLGVLPEYRNHGIGRRLLTALRDKAFAEGHEKAGLLVDKENPNAERLYLSLGFQRIEARKLFGHQMWHLQATKPKDQPQQLTESRF